MHLTTYIVPAVLLLLQVEARLFGRSVGKPHRSIGNHGERRSKAVNAVAQRNETTTDLVSDTKEHELQKRAFDGHATFYQVGQGACGGSIDYEPAYVVALNQAQYGGGYPGPQCGRKISIQGGPQNGFAEAVITDLCPECPWGAIDMSKALFQNFAPLASGTATVNWWFNDEGPGPPPQPTSSWAPETSLSWAAPTSTVQPWTSTWSDPASSAQTSGNSWSSSSSTAPSSWSEWQATTTSEWWTAQSSETWSASSSSSWSSSASWTPEATSTSSWQAASTTSASSPWSAPDTSAATTTAVNLPSSSEAEPAVPSKGDSTDHSGPTDRTGNLDTLRMIAVNFGRLVVRAAANPADI